MQERIGDDKRKEHVDEETWTSKEKHEAAEWNEYGDTGRETHRDSDEKDGDVRRDGETWRDMT